jgi:hypothetical protein
MFVGTAAEITMLRIVPTGGGTRVTQNKEENGDHNDIAMHQLIFWIAGGNSSPSKLIFRLLEATPRLRLVKIFL